MIAALASSAVQAQTYSGTFTGVVTTSQIVDHPFVTPDIVYDFNGQTITGTFYVDFTGGFTNGNYSGSLPTFGFGGSGSDSDDDSFDWASFSALGGIGSLRVDPDLIGIDSAASFTIDFNLSALNNPMIPLIGTGSYNFYYNQGGSTGGDLDGFINFAFTGGTLVGVVPEPAAWAMLIGGMFLAGAGVRRRAQATIPA
ncbi:PEP-CTERM sorting domain-containing protein [Sphingomonas sp. JC676]|uniref:PEP-CTERM sorting domain-containing protein n=1 Tax=Sphingomonas sp. JC676 TaxID=2768065 RepID=UPI00165774A1|nr:PEP-CTERM sorting domain-containing protein [Sphingomonas sp. JC676]MBC9034827.1 PEP-CTERM sorting domain-containing protein [Sphingomonas sp. JC676]